MEKISAESKGADLSCSIGIFRKHKQNIAFDKKGVFGYIWNPKLAKLLSKRLEVKI